MSGFLAVFFIVYFALNFACALALHLHGERQAHLPIRFLDVVVHFVVMTAVAIPVLTVVMATALFGGEEAGKPRAGRSPATRAA